MDDTVSTIDPRPLAHEIGDEARAAQDAKPRAVREQARAMGAPLAEARAKAEAAAAECGPEFERFLASLPGDLARLPGPDAESLREIRRLAQEAQMLCAMVVSMYDSAETFIAKARTRDQLPYVRLRVAPLIGLDRNIRTQLEQVRGALDLLAQRRADQGEDAPPIVPLSFVYVPPKPPRSSGVRSSLSPEDRR